MPQPGKTLEEIRAALRQIVSIWLNPSRFRILGVEGARPWWLRRASVCRWISAGAGDGCVTRSGSEESRWARSDCRVLGPLVAPGLRVGGAGGVRRG